MCYPSALNSNLSSTQDPGISNGESEEKESRAWLKGLTGEGIKNIKKGISKKQEGSRLEKQRGLLKRNYEALAL